MNLDLFQNPYQKEFSFDRHKELIKKLKFISKIEIGERINVNNISTSSHNIFSSIYRTIFKEGRNKTFLFLNDVIDRSFELLLLYKDSKKISDKITYSHIIDDLVSSINGLKNLQNTYLNDRNFYCDIDTLIGSIFARLAEFYENDNNNLTKETKDKIRKFIFPENKEELKLDE